MTEDELLECPFCGNAAVLVESTDTKYPHFKVTCTEIGCVGSATNLWHGSKELAISSWNTRVFPAWLREKIVDMKQTYYCSDVLDKVLSLTPGEKYTPFK